MALAGSAEWSGAPGLPVVSATYTCAHGVTPGVAQVVTPWVDPTAIPRYYGTLTFRDGVNAPVNIPGCRIARVDRVELEGGVPGLALTILDARHRWAYGSVDGLYNLIDNAPDPTTVPTGTFGVRNGIFAPGTERTPEQLLALCFARMNVPVVFRGVPADARPPVDWRGDNPARAADRVAEAVGCRIVYQPLAHRVLVTPPGGPARLDPRLPALDERPTLDTAARPTVVQVQGGDSLLTDVVKLEAVGWEEDGRLRPIEELSYAPADGWWNYSPDYRGWWNAVRKGDSTGVEVSRALASAFVWKLFRVAGVPVDPKLGRRQKANLFNWPAPVFGPIPNRRLITVSDRRVMPDKDAKGQHVVKPARVIWNGANFPKNKAGVLKNFPAGFTLGDPEVPFQVDPDRGLITFARPMYRIREKRAAGGDAEPDLDYQKYGPQVPGRLQYVLADAYLECTIRTRDPATWQYKGERWAQRLGRDDGGDLVEVVRRPDLQLVYQVARNPITLGRQPRSDRSNARELKGRAAAVLAAAAARHAVAPAAARTLAGILPVMPDAVVHSVTWSVGGGPPTTRVGLNTETEPYLPAFAERRANERALDFLTADWVRKNANIPSPLG